MRVRVRCFVVVAFVMSLGVLTFSAAPASADSTTTVYCAGDSAAVSWAPPADTSELTSYYVVDSLFNDAVDGWDVSWQSVPLTETSTTVSLFAGFNSFIIFGTTATSLEGGGVIGSQEITAGVAPQPEAWFNNPSYNTVGDGTATVDFHWNGPVNAGTQGYIGANETVSDGSQTVAASSPGAPVTFTGLNDGQAYTFTSTTFNACGSSTSGSPTFVPGVGPEWASDSPPLVARFRLYAAHFHASGDPAPFYQLVGAPPWLHVLSSGALAGLVYGLAPRGTTSFSYSVTAENGVGVAPGEGLGFPSTDITAGPFTVTVKPA
jgi:hypothetical protein